MALNDGEKLYDNGEVKAKKPLYKRRWVWFLLSVVIIYGMFSSNEDNKLEANKPIESSEQEESNEEEPKEKESSTDSNADNSEVKEEQTLKQIIEETIIRTVKKDKIIDLQVNDNASTDGFDDKIVTVKIDETMNFTVNMTKKSILMDSKNIMKRLFENTEVSEVVLFWKLPFKDVYGNEKYDIALKVGVNREVADKVNWEDFDYNDFYKIAPTYWESNAFNK
jgi:hypothetical protein